MRHVLLAFAIITLTALSSTGEQTAARRAELREKAARYQEKQTTFQQDRAAFRAKRVADNEEYNARVQANADMRAAARAAAQPAPIYVDPYPSIYYIRPYDPISDYWGIYAPGHPRGGTWVFAY